MTPQLEQAIAAARALAPHEQIQLLEVVAQNLRQLYALTADSAVFWAPPTLAEQFPEQTTAAVFDVRALAADFWPADESADDLNRYVAAQRRAEGHPRRATF